MWSSLSLPTPPTHINFCSGKEVTLPDPNLEFEHLPLLHQTPSSSKFHSNFHGGGAWSGEPSQYSDTGTDTSLTGAHTSAQWVPGLILYYARHSGVEANPVSSTWILALPRSRPPMHCTRTHSLLLHTHCDGYVGFSLLWHTMK